MTARDFQLPMFMPGSEWKLPVLSKLPSWKGAKRVAIDVETNDPSISSKLGLGVRRGGYVCGVSFAIEDGPAAYLPVRHQNGENFEPAKVFAYLRRQARVFKGKGTVIGGANLPYDLDYLLEEDVAFEPEFFRDVQVAEPLLDELQNRYSLEIIAQRYGLPGKDETLLLKAAEAFKVNPKSGLWRLPPEYVGAYAERDVRLPLTLLRRQEKRIDDEDLWPIYDLESRLLPVLVRMRRRGVRISHDQLDRVEAWSLVEEARVLGEIHQQTGVRVAVGDVMKAGDMARVLDAIGVRAPLTPKTQKPSVTTELLEALDHPVAALMVRSRKVNKVRTTFVESIRRHEVNGRIHCTLKQLRGSDREEKEGGPRYGRLSSTDPNLQQQPSRDPEIGPMWRAVYLPEDGELWACLDYSQQEPRWLTHYAYLSKCRGAAEAVERYRNDPSTDNHRMMTILIHGQGAWNAWDKKNQKFHREQAKQIFLAKCYGMGGAKLCKKLSLPTQWSTHRLTGRDMEVAGPEGQAIIRQFDQGAPYVKELAGRCEKQADLVGFIYTVLGRRCRFPKAINGNGYEWTHKALNRLVQGSSADQTKAAMVAADKEGIPLQLQVHDELDLSVPSIKATERLAEIMRDVVPCEVPHRIDVETGPDWGHIKK